jgi:hypothetical protein
MDSGYYMEVGTWSGTEKQQDDGTTDRIVDSFLYLNAAEYEMVRKLLHDLAEGRLMV